ncbi:hypothetical protein [Arthrobacter sp. KBS0703]|uniref:hypothetical protein n=1 Tax=Arthrobacter sp. KBS0703 TaxID=1955698 RepID=UPI0037BFB6B8
MAPAGGPACGFACGSGGVDRFGAGPVHGPRREYLQVFGPAGDLLGEPGEIRGLRETGQGQLTGCGFDGGFQQPQAPLQAVACRAKTGGTKAGGSTAVGRHAIRAEGRSRNAAQPGGPAAGQPRQGLA